MTIETLLVIVLIGYVLSFVLWTCTVIWVILKVRKVARSMTPERRRDHNWSWLDQ